MSEHFVAALADFADRDRRIVEIEGLEIGVFRIGDTVVAYQNRCPHQGGPACQGRIMPKVEQPLGPFQTALGLRFSETTVHVVCPWHGYEFSLETGAHPGHAGIRLRRFDTVIRDGGVHVVI